MSEKKVDACLFCSGEESRYFVVGMGSVCSPCLGLGPHSIRSRNEKTDWNDVYLRLGITFWSIKKKMKLKVIRWSGYDEKVGGWFGRG